MKRVGIIGLGDISIIHVKALEFVNNAKIVALCDIDESLKDKYKGYTFYKDYKEMFEKENLDSVHICLPHYLHYTVSKDAIDAGINVFLEKPVGLNLEEAKKLIEIEENNPHLKICVCLQNRLNNSFVELLNIVKSGKYGKIKGVKGIVTWSRPEQYYTSKPWRKSKKFSGGGVMINQTIHTLDLMQLLAGKIEKVKGLATNLLDYSDFEVEDTALAKIVFENDVMGVYFATVAYSENSSVEIQAILEYGKFTIKNSKLFIDEENGKKLLVEDEKLPGIKHYYGASHKKLIQKFYEALENDTDDYIHAKDALVSMELVEKIGSIKI